MSCRIAAPIERVAEALGGGPDLRFFRAPGRVNPRGDHTDYEDGFVLPAAIDRECLIAVRARGDDAVASTVPIGAGLSSSAALEVAVALAADLDLLVVHSGTTRRLADGAYAERRADCAHAAADIRAVGRVAAAATRLRRQDPLPRIEVEGVDPFYAVTRRAHIVEIERQPQYTASTFGGGLDVAIRAVRRAASQRDRPLKRWGEARGGTSVSGAFRTTFGAE